MLKHIIAGAAVFSLAGACLARGDAVDEMGKKYLATTFAMNPGSGAAAGLHTYDGRPPNMSAAAVENERRELHLIADELVRHSSPKARALLATVNTDLFNIEVLRAYQRNPMTYASAIDASLYAKRDFAPKADRAVSAAKLLEGTPAVVAAGKANLDGTLPKVFVETAISIARGQADFAEGDLVRAFDDIDDADAKARLRKAADLSAAAMRDYADWLTTRRLPDAKPAFAMGSESFARMLHDEELLTQSPEEILALGMAELDRKQRAFVSAAQEIDPSRPAELVWLDVQRDHPTPQTLLSDTRQHLEQIRAFFMDKGIIRFPTSQSVIVEDTPRFLRATTFASMDAPGPFETRATESFYYVTPTEPEWDAKKVEEWLTAFNYYTTDIVSVHEAYPGHFVQALHLHASDADGAWRYIGSYAFIEGWAHYCEQMAIDENFPPDSLASGEHARAKYKMAQASEALLRCCRLVASIRMHCQGMTLDEATKFFVENCHYTQATARNEAERGSYDPGYCFYTIGKLQFFKLREDWKKQEGEKYSLTRFHDEALRHGMPPLRLLRELMLKDPAHWDKTLE